MALMWMMTVHVPHVLTGLLCAYEGRALGVCEGTWAAPALGSILHSCGAHPSANPSLAAVHSLRCGNCLLSW